MTALAERAVSCKGWRWMPGMLDADEGLVCPSRFDEADDQAAWADALPDLGDPATLGCLLALVREAWDDSDAYAAPHGERLCWRVDIDPDSWGEDHDHPEGKTEAEALVAALEAAP